MPVYKDKNNGTWFCKFYYRDWCGSSRQKWKRGFMTKKEAQMYERNFLQRQTVSPDILFENLYYAYLEEMSARLKYSTIVTKRNICETKILPFFGKKPVNEIRAADIRKWQNYLLESKRGYSKTYLKNINNQLSAIINFARKYYNLETNPCEQAGSIGTSKADGMQCWTLEEFFAFRKGIKDRTESLICFDVLYWTGMREGELLALSERDIDFEKKEISINKSYQRLERQDVITTPKTRKSRRRVSIPDFLCRELLEYMEGPCYDKRNERCFPFSKAFLNYEMRRGCRNTGVKKIRVHDIRHSHVSLLIDQGFDALVIADRVGHENVSTTLNTYAHLFPNKQMALVSSLESLGMRQQDFIEIVAE